MQSCACRALLWHSLVRRSCGRLLLEDLATRQVSKRHSCRTVLYSLVGAVVRAFRTRRPPKVKCQASSRSLYETSFKKSLVQPPKRPPRKRAFRMRRPPKVKWEAPSERTHQAALPSAPLNTTAADTPPNVATSRFPAPATKIQLRLPRKVTT